MACRFAMRETGRLRDAVAVISRWYEPVAGRAATYLFRMRVGAWKLGQDPTMTFRLSLSSPHFFQEVDSTAPSLGTGFTFCFYISHTVQKIETCSC